MLRPYAFATLTLIAASFVREARAQTAEAPADDVRARARQIASQGDTEFASGRCDRAIRLWKEADKIFSATTIELRIAHCQALVGHVVDAAATMEAIVGKTLPSDAPEPFVAAQTQAASELATLRTRIATLTLQMRAPAGTEVWIDEEKRTTERPTYPLDPGRHRIRVQHGTDVGEKVIDLEDGEKRSLSVSTVLVKAQPVTRPGRTAGFIFGGAGIALLGVGSVLGVMALTQSGTLDERCGPNHDACPPEDRDSISELKTKALASNLFLGGGVVLLGVGGFLLWQSTRVEQPPARVRLTVSGLGGNLEGHF